MIDPADYRLSVDGAVEVCANPYALMEEVAQLRRIKAKLDKLAPWTATVMEGCTEPPTVEERVDAVLRFTKERMVENV